MEKYLEILKYTMEILAILGVTVEIMPVKFSPLKWIGKRFHSSINDRIDKLESNINSLYETVDMNDIATVRNRICAFDNLCRMDINNDSIKRHQYATVFKDIDRWNRYHIKYPKLNGEIKTAIENIEEHFKKAKFDD